MKPHLLERLICPACGGDRLESTVSGLTCQACSARYPLENGIPLFSPVPGEMVPFDVFERGPDLGTRWRQANWKFLQQNTASLPPGAVILDVGAGRGDFAPVFKDFRYLALDLYPYPELDLVTDLTRISPFKPVCMDVVILANVLEHVKDPSALLNTLKGLLAPGGLILVTIPFLLKEHQAPYDFTRFTRFGLHELGQSAGLEMIYIEGYYDPAFLLTEARQNIERFGLRGLPRPQRGAGRVALAAIRLLEALLENIAGRGRTAQPGKENSPAPVGYHVIFHKPQKGEGAG